MASDSEAKYRGAFWKFIALVLCGACVILFTAFMIALYVIITGPPTLDQVQKAHLESLKSAGNAPLILYEHTEDVSQIAGNAKTFYNALQVKPDASMEEIAHAYHKLAKQFHPDLNKSPIAPKIFMRIAEAYETLKDPKSRAEYDMKLRENSDGHKLEPNISMQNAMNVFAIFEQMIREQQSSFGPIFGIRFRSNGDDPVRASIPGFPMVGSMLQMMGAMPAQLAYHGKTTDDGGHVVHVKKICRGNHCKITVLRT